MSFLIATDLDGTLLFPKRRLQLVTRDNKNFLRDAVAKGNSVVLVTGRGQRFCHKVARSLKVNCDFVMYNGSAIEIEGVILPESQKFIDQQILLDIDQVAKSYPSKKARLLVCSDDRLIGAVWKLSLLEKLFLLYVKLSHGRLFEKVEYQKGLFEEVLLANQGIYKYSLIFVKKGTSTQKEIFTSLKAKYGDVLEIQNLNHSIEVTAKNVNKATAMEMLIKKLGISEEEVLVVGDDGNDIPLLKRFPNSFAMSNAKQEVKKVAKYQIKRVSELKNYIKGAQHE